MIAQALASFERVIKLLESILLRQGGGYGPFLNPGTTTPVGAEPVRIYRARNSPATLVFQTEATGAAGDQLYLSPENASYQSAFRVEVGSEDRTVTLRVAASQDLYAVAILANPAVKLSVNLLETA